MTVEWDEMLCRIIPVEAGSVICIDCIRNIKPRKRSCHEYDNSFVSSS